MMKQKLEHTKKVDLNRKMDSLESKPNKMSTDVKKKAPLKSELQTELNALHLKYSAFEMENKQNLETIRHLETKMKEL